MRQNDPLRAALGLLRPRLTRVILAILLGVLALGSALALAGVSAWLITRASQMPPVLDLSIAAVSVRLFAISRAVLRYCERLVSHDTALRAATSAREQIYERMAHDSAADELRLSSGELVARVGSDVDELSNVLVRALIPAGVAAVLATAATAVIAVISLPAAAVLAVCLLVAGVAAPWLAGRAATAQENLARAHHAERDTAAMTALDHAPQLRVAGALSGLIEESRDQQRIWGTALDAAARPAAIAEAMPTAAIGVSVLGAAVAAITMTTAVAPTTLAILMLLPLSAFEAVVPLPAAAVQLARARIAARRLHELAPTERTPRIATAAVPAGTGSLHADIISGRTSHLGAAVVVDLPPGSRLACTGPSGSGKTTVLMTLAGLVPPMSGQVRLDGTPLSHFDDDQLHGYLSFFAEDAHVFTTTVRDNLLVVQGDCTDAELIDALAAVGLSGWLAGLPDGLSTVLIGGGQALSAGQRRRLLLARAILSPARILLLDEPTEHLDAADADAVLRDLLGSTLFGADRTVVVATHHLPTDTGCPELALGAHSHGPADDRSLSVPDTALIHITSRTEDRRR